MTDLIKSNYTPLFMYFWCHHIPCGGGGDGDDDDDGDGYMDDGLTFALRQYDNWCHRGITELLQRCVTVMLQWL
jgi:hypothetical protein